MYSDRGNKGQDVGGSVPIGLDLPAAHALDERQTQLLARASGHSAWHGASVTAPTGVVARGLVWVSRPAVTVLTVLPFE